MLIWLTKFLGKNIMTILSMQTNQTMIFSPAHREQHFNDVSNNMWLTHTEEHVLQYYYWLIIV